MGINQPATRHGLFPGYYAYGLLTTQMGLLPSAELLTQHSTPQRENQAGEQKDGGGGAGPSIKDQDLAVSRAVSAGRVGESEQRRPGRCFQLF